MAILVTILNYADMGLSNCCKYLCKCYWLCDLQNTHEDAGNENMSSHKIFNVNILC